MGIDVYVFEFLLGNVHGKLGDALCLGRQRVSFTPENGQWDAACATLARHDPDCALETLVGPDGYAETLLKYLGCRSTRSLDYSPYEGAEIICDLNNPVPKGLFEKFDLILDGGTLEHVYNVPVAFLNVKRMLRPGGLFISINAANNQLGHGLYQFSPDLFRRAFAREMGFVIEKMQIVPLSGALTPEDILHSDDSRREYGPTATATYLMVAARLVEAGLLTGRPIYQSDYAATWKAHGG